MSNPPTDGAPVSQDPVKPLAGAAVDGSAFRRVVSVLTHPLGMVIVTFVLTGVVATVFSKWLDNLSKSHEIELAARQRATESVRTVTDLIYERRIRSQILSSSITRGAPPEEIKDRKKAYDDVFVRYNATLQSNMFRIREIFHTTDYTEFEYLLEGPVRKLFVLADRCLTSAYDVSILTDEAKRQSAADILANCNRGTLPVVPLGVIHQAILDCAYSYTDVLFRVVQSSKWPQGVARLTKDHADQISKRCELPTPS